MDGYKIPKAIYSENAPYLVVLLFAAISWTVTHLVDRVIESPTIEYSMYHASSVNGKKKAVFTVTNITKTKMFANIKFEVTGDLSHPINVINAYINSYGTSNQGDIEPNYQAKDSATFTIQQFQPNESFELVVDFNGERYPKIQLGNFPKTQEKGNIVRLMRSSFETKLVRYEYSIFCFLLFFMLLVIVYIYSSSSEKDGKQENE